MKEWYYDMFTCEHHRRGDGHRCATTRGFAAQWFEGVKLIEMRFQSGKLTLETYLPVVNSLLTDGKCRFLDRATKRVACDLTATALFRDEDGKLRVYGRIGEMRQVEDDGEDFVAKQQNYLINEYTRTLPGFWDVWMSSGGRWGWDGGTLWFTWGEKEDANHGD